MNRLSLTVYSKFNSRPCGLLVTGVIVPLSILATATELAHAQQAGSPVQLPAVNVQGTGNPNSGLLNAALAPYQAPLADLGPLGKQQLLDVPQSITIIPESLIDNQQAKTVNDTLRYLPSVEIRDQQGLEVSRPQSRGFQGSIVQNTRLDGLNLIGTSAIPAENLSGIQVLNGLGGALFGPETPAGVFDYTLKKPTDATFFQYKQSFDSQSIFTEQIDAGGRVGPDQRLGYRVNIVHGQGEGYVDESSTNRTLGSIFLDYRLTDHTVIEGYYSHYATDITGLPGQITYNSQKNTVLPQAVNPTQLGLGQPGAGSNLVSDTGLVKIKHSFNSDWTLEIGGLYENAHRGLFGITDTLTDNKGNFTVTKNYTAVPHFTIISNSAYLNGRFDLFGMKNDVTIGTNGYINGQYSYRNSIAVPNFGSANLNNLVVFASPPTPATGGEVKSGSVFQQSIITGDTIHFNEQWALQGVLSTTFFNQQSFANTGLQTSSTTANAALSPTVSLLYKPIPQLTLYATYSNSTEQSDQAPATAANPNAFLAPYHDTMYEVGAKYAFNPNFLVTLDGFRMTRPLAETDATTNVFSVVGTQRNYGVELFGQGALTPELSVLGGVTYIDARLTDTGVASTNDMLVIGVPHWKSDFVVDYHPDFWHGFALNGAFHYESARAANNINTTFADSYATLDLGARYSTVIAGHLTTARFQVINVTDKFYYSSLADGTSIVGANGGDTAFFGAPRTFEASLEVNF
jgi:iron complex outermembrane recepter protein